MQSIVQHVFHTTIDTCNRLVQVEFKIVVAVGVLHER